MADSAVWFLVNGALGRLEPMTVTSELSIRFLRPAKGDKLYARAHQSAKERLRWSRPFAFLPTTKQPHRSRTSHLRSASEVR